MAGDTHDAETQEKPQAQEGLGFNQEAQEQPHVSDTDWEKAVAERDEKIAALAAQATERLRGEIAKLKALGESDRIDFKLQLAGVRNVKVARALLGDHDNDVNKLKEAEPWLFEASGKHAKGGANGGTGATRLPNAGVASNEGKTLKHWREIAGLTDDDDRQ